VGVDRDRGPSPHLGEDDARGLPPHAGKGDERVEIVRDPPIEPLDESPGETEEGTGLLAVVAGGVDHLLHRLGIGGGEVLRGGPSGEEDRGDAVHRLVGRLGREDRGDEELPRILVSERRPDRRVPLLEALPDDAGPVAPGRIRWGGLRRHGAGCYRGTMRR